MMRELQSNLTADERSFLLTLVAAKPDWGLLGIPDLDRFPGLRWKLHNLDILRKTNMPKFTEQSDALQRLLS